MRARLSSVSKLICKQHNGHVNGTVKGFAGTSSHFLAQALLVTENDEERAHRAGERPETRSSRQGTQASGQNHPPLGPPCCSTHCPLDPGDKVPGKVVTADSADAGAPESSCPGKGVTC